ncbi:hypothetical protein I547_4275 [Mycobacterium kansasii 824]|nr:hypothetical protein I547_4275 [Mycobacterium kansasii 824]
MAAAASATAERLGQPAASRWRRVASPSGCTDAHRAALAGATAGLVIGAGTAQEP